MTRVLLLIASLIGLSGCATVRWQSDEVLKRPQAVPESHQIANVPFVEQKAGHCGPATLTMAMAFAGADVSVEQIGPEVFTPGNKGSLQMDLISAARRHGFMAIPLEGMDPLLREVAAGNPVIVFENLGLKWFPKWHYAIVHGYDLSRKEIVLHSGTRKNMRVGMHRFEDAWARGGYWGLIVLPPDRLAKTADELAHGRAAAGMEQAGRAVEAEKAYRRILETWPKSLAARVGLANIAFQRNDLRSAIENLRQAQKDHPTSLAVAHNLAVAEKAAKLLKK